MPPFYIGSSRIDRIHNGYRGSVSSKRYKSTWYRELKLNPHLFKTVILTYHSSRKEATIKESTFQTKLSVIQNPLYINLAIHTENNSVYEHQAGWHAKDKNPMYGRRHTKETKARMSASAKTRKRRPFSEEARKNMSKAQSGKNNPMYGKKRNHSIDTKIKISQSLLGRPSSKRKQIAQCSIDGDIITIWQHAKEASDYFGYAAPSNIRMAARSNGKTIVGGFSWKYV